MKLNKHTQDGCLLLNNGFTLIELLAVIIILSLLALIASTAVTKLVKDAKSDLSDSQMKLIKSAAEGWGASNLKLLPNENECKYITLGDLKEYGLMDSKIMNTKTNEEIPDSLLIKITGSLNKFNKIVINYEVDPENVDGCSMAYPPKLNPQGTYLVVNSAVDNADTYFFGQEQIKRNQVETIKFTYTNKVPGNVLGSWDASEAQDGSIVAWYTDMDNNNLYELYIGGENGVKANPNSSNLFAFFINTINIDMKYLDTSEVTNMHTLLNECNNLISLNMNGFDTSKVTDMSGMFKGCSSLTNLDLSHFNTSNVVDFHWMFYNCTNLKKVDLSGFNTSKVIYMNSMFGFCTNLIELDLSSFDTSNVTNMSAIFRHCESLKTLDLNNFDTTKVTTMDSLFAFCIKLTSIDIRRATFNNATVYNEMFNSSSNLSNIIVKDTTAKTFIESRLTDMKITGVTVTIA